MTHYTAVDQYGQTYHGLAHPRKDLCERIGRQHVARMYVDRNDGSSAHVGYVIGGHWLTVYRVERMDKAERKVVVEVLGGVADVTTCPADVEVEVIDHDNLEAEGG
jgi:hypothetical protein